MQRFQAWFAGLALLALALLGVTFVVSAGLTRSAELVQLVQPAEGGSADLFGTSSGPGTPIGSPQVMIIRDPAAFLEGRSEAGARYVSDTYLKQNSIYPLQLKSVALIRTVVTLSCVAAAALFGVLWWLARRNGAAGRRPA
ncbi:hypothetical protein HNQ07_000928 [Deinococcus metalli]|uniref:Uncharacterized protein n=1 Tax=Deinococcus metalli TaxID=1141878 RepID=A0A7W8NM71_9DEIO|nr:hypothetical protein [Deinococcus metalli]MBB5375484.1 hypothetical protein [Deinococcus metalli]GHF28929.1 hypothetical protein GCM10017781_01120 [Deinococcus metalli]